MSKDTSAAPFAGDFRVLRGKDRQGLVLPDRREGMVGDTGIEPVTTPV